MKWVKIGRIFKTDMNHPWMQTHSAVPFLEHLNNDFYKIYFTTRNRDNKSNIAWLVIDLKSPLKVLEISEEALLPLGEPGCFDEDGVMGCQYRSVGDKRFIYYQGWNLGVSIPFRNSIGLAVQNEEKIFTKISAGPILDRGIHDNCFVATPHVIRENDKYLMYYLSCDAWEPLGDKLIHRYNIKMAESNDGINWERSGNIAINYKSKEEFAISVPRVLKDDSIFKMWYSYRGFTQKYRIGYAESIDGFTWTRRDEECGIDISSEGWDSEMICYPYVFDHNGERYMLYNGNEYGKEGFGIAILKK